MTPDELKARTKQFALRTIRMCETLPRTRAGNIIANQLIRSATSVGANYRSACRARSDADFVSKIGITLEEADESVYWMELIVESGMKTEKVMSALFEEGKELVAIFVSSANTASRRLHRTAKSKAKSEI